MIRIPDLTKDEVNRALDETFTNLDSKIKRITGASGTFTVDGTTITVVGGLITKIGD